MDEIKRRFEQRYLEGNTPWDSGRPDGNLIEILESYDITGKRALEIGCGTGDNAIFLSKRGFDVTATEIVEMAMEAARAKASEAGARCCFMLENIVENSIDGAPFDFVFDRGCFHSFDTQVDREKFVQSVARHMVAGGYWLSLIGNADDKRQGPGPPRRTATEIVTVVEPLFEIVLLKAGYFDSDMKPPPKNWILLARCR